MRDNDNAAYYMNRAEEEEKAALQTANPLAKKIHLSLAARYRASALEREEGERLRLVRD